jgi:plastocyanin
MRGAILRLAQIEPPDRALRTTASLDPLVCLGFRPMRRHRLILAPITALAALAVAAPSLAADVGVDVANGGDFTFTPKTRSIAVGDKVVWSFNDGGHTTTSVPGQAVSWDSGNKDRGESFEKTFTRAGRFQYVCTPHESFMNGTIVVGKDSVSDTVDAFKTKVSGTKVTISFELNEAARATYQLTGASKRTVTRKRLRAGAQSITVKRLKAGSYTGTLTLSDDFDKKTKQKKSFKVG